MNQINLNAEERKVFGKKLKSIRKDGALPVNVFGRSINSYALQVNYQEFEKVYNEAGETGLIELKTGSKNVPILIHSIQRDPVSNKMLHADLIQVDLKQKVSAEVPIEIIGEAPAEKQGLGTMVLQMNEIQVEALPADLPDKFEIDVSLLTEEDQSLTVADIKVDAKKVEIKEDLQSVVVKIEKAKEEKEEVVAPPAEEGVDVVESTEKGEEDSAGEEGASNGVNEETTGQ